MFENEKLMQNIAFAVASSVLIAGCAVQAPTFTPVVAQTIGRHPGSLQSVSVQADPEGLQAGQIKMIWGADEIPVLWKQATEAAVLQSGVFTGRGERKYDVLVTILVMKPPAQALTVNTPAKARYDVIDAETRRILFSTEVDTVGRVALGDNFSGAVRIRNSISRATQSNILEFLKRLQAATL